MIGIQKAIHIQWIQITKFREKHIHMKQYHMCATNLSISSKIPSWPVIYYYYFVPRTPNTRSTLLANLWEYNLAYNLTAVSDMDSFTALGKDVDLNGLMYVPLSSFPVLYDRSSTFEGGLGGIRVVFLETVLVPQRARMWSFSWPH